MRAHGDGCVPALRCPRTWGVRQGCCGSMCMSVDVKGHQEVPGGSRGYPACIGPHGAGRTLCTQGGIRIVGAPEVGSRFDAVARRFRPFETHFDALTERRFDDRGSGMSRGVRAHRRRGVGAEHIEQAATPRGGVQGRGRGRGDAEPEAVRVSGEAATVLVHPPPKSESSRAHAHAAAVAPRSWGAARRALPIGD